MHRSGILALVFSAVLLAGSIRPATAAWMLPPSPYRAKDFTIVKHEGWYHCFYIRNDTTAPFDSTERDFGHAISRDLHNWTQLAPVLPIRPGSWDNFKVWAPSIVRVDGVFYMFYTGVTHMPGVYDHHQRVGLATSTDLTTWNRLDEPLFACDQVPWTVCDPQQPSGGEFRDPFVIADGQGGWRMYYNTRPAAAPGTYVVGVASSPGDLMQWADLNPLWISQHAWSGSALVESPHVFQRADGTWYLMFTGDAGQPLRLATGPDPTGDPETWTFRGTLGAMLGFNTQLWFASEFFRDGLVEYLAFVNYDRVDVRRVQWNPDWTFQLKSPDLMHVYDLRWSAGQATPGTAVQLVLQVVNAIGQWVKLGAWVRHADGTETPVAPSLIGLPDSVWVSSPLHSYSWTARSWPGSVSDTSVAIVAGTADQTARTEPLVVLPGPFALEPADGSPGQRLIPREQWTYGRTAARGIRVLERSPLGGPALLVDLAAAAPVRVDLFDLAGRRIRTLADREFPRGATVLAWDGRDAGGSAAGPGVYFARVRAGDAEHTLRMLLLAR